MDVVSPKPYWRLKNGLKQSLPTLNEDLTTDVMIVGGGISGLLAAYHFCEAGIDCVLIDEYDIGAASTSASTALLQYEIDEPLVELAKLRTPKEARLAYLASLEAVLQIGQLAHKLGHSAYRSRESLFLASTEEDDGLLLREYQARKELGIDITHLNRAQIQARFPFQNTSALLSATSAEIDPYVFTDELLTAALSMGLRAYDRTVMKTFEMGKETESHSVQVHLVSGNTIRARDLVMATGYNAVTYLPDDLFSLKSTFAMVTKPKSNAEQLLNNCLIWESSHPYCYLRTTPDQRILIGGLDEDFIDPTARDKVLAMKEKQLLSRLHDYFPNERFEVGYSWAGTFCETADGLPVIGAVPGAPHCHFALGFGGNGITFSLLAAEILRDQLSGRPNEYAELFSFSRFIRK